jgi:hypothetical protein
MLDTLLQVDPRTIIPPYNILDRSNRNHPDLSATRQIYGQQVPCLDSLLTAKRYFSRLSPRLDNGFVYCSCIIAQTIPFADVMTNASASLANLGIGLWPKACDHETAVDVAWFLYSTRFQEADRLLTLLSKLIGEKISIKYKNVRTTTFNKKDPNDISEPTRALHVEAPIERASEIRAKLRRLYGKGTRSFPDGTKMRIIPTFKAVFSSEGKSGFGTLVSLQSALQQKIATGNSWEFNSNLALDEICPADGKTLRELIMEIPSSSDSTIPLFHSVDKMWRSERGVCFTSHLSMKQMQECTLLV